LTDSDGLRRRATELGVETSYWDVAGNLHDAPDATLRAVVDVLEADAAAGSTRQLDPVLVAPADPFPVHGVTDLHLTLADGTKVELHRDAAAASLPPDLPIGCHRLEVSANGREEVTTVVVPPPTMPRDPTLAGGSGLFVPTYALWEHAAPLPSFADLAALAGCAPRLGVDVISTLPLYAAFLDEPFDPSPYSPMSRLHWNEVYIDDAALPAAPDAGMTELIDWQALARRRRLQLLDHAGNLDPSLLAAVMRFVASRPDVADFARYRAARPEPVDAGRPAALVRRSHELAQHLADCQLASVEGAGRAALALDLPIGSHPDGYETWACGALFAPAIAVGAPPDEFFADGQNWGFPPQLPAAGRRSGHELWQRLVARAGEHASMLRIDHVMGVQRLWWIPEGASATDGVYVRYPRDELLAVIAAQAAVTATTIVGEDLGTVPQEVTDAMDRWDMLGMYEEQFLLYRDDEHLVDLDPIPARSVAGLRTHDMPAFNAAVVDDAARGVDSYRRLLAAALRRPVGTSAADLLDAALERLAASDAYLVLVDLDDLVGETEPHNVPGQVLPTTWRRRLRAPTSEVLATAEVRRRLELLTSCRGRTR
jgi:4-alpha-glucanotransferase